MTYNDSIDDRRNKCSKKALPGLLGRELNEPSTTKEEACSTTNNFKGREYIRYTRTVFWQ